jgi:hypothetical protein
MSFRPTSFYFEPSSSRLGDGPATTQEISTRVAKFQQDLHRDLISLDRLRANLVTNSYRGLSGLEPEKSATNTLLINPGSCANSNGSALYSTSSQISIDLTTTGVNALDTGTITDGVDYFVYLIAPNRGTTLAAVVSASQTYGGVTLPTGYQNVRKLPFGFVYNAAWGGIPDFHLTFWPKPFIRLTGAEETSTWRALNSGTATTFTDVDLSGFMPDNARVAYIGCRAETPSAATPGFAAIRVLSSQTSGWSVGNPPAGFDTYSTLWQRVTSVRKLQYKVTNGTKLSIFVLGYGMTEAS